MEERFEENAAFDLISSFLGPVDTSTNSNSKSKSKSSPVEKKTKSPIGRDNVINPVSISKAERERERECEGKCQKQKQKSASRKKKFGSEDDSGADAQIIIFSKDRPWQLQQLMRSMKLELDESELLHHNNSNDDDDGGVGHLNFHIYIIVKVNVLYKKGYNEVKEYYDRIMRNHHSSSSINWLYESENTPFSELLETAIGISSPLEGEMNKNTNTNCVSTSSSLGKENNETSTTSSSVIMFLTDDCILMEPIKTVLYTSKSVLQAHIHSYEDENESGTHSQIQKVIAFLTRLHPGISYCQTMDKASPPPRSNLTYWQVDADEELSFSQRRRLQQRQRLDAFVYPQDLGLNDFNYPFDLSGGVYRKSTVIEILQRIKNLRNKDEGECEGHSHPNKFEINGNRAMRRLLDEEENHEDSTIGLLSFPAHPALLILAINRVQEICHAPIATPSASEEEYTCEHLLQYLEHKQMLDLHRYRATMFDTSHIGSMYLKKSIEGEKISSTSSTGKTVTTDDPTVSVLIPVYCGPPLAASLAMRSILFQAIEDKDIIAQMQIVIVDDRCMDGSIDAMLDCAKSLAEEYAIELVLSDKRCKDDFSPTATKSMTTASSSISIDVIQSPGRGLGAALNFGLKKCRSELVARMDADDVSLPGRLASQVSHMNECRDINVLGTNSILFTDACGGESDNLSSISSRITLPYSDEHGAYKMIRSSVQPSDAGFVAWAMLFSCVISHPSVMFRKTAIVREGGYRDSECVTEDYDLWLRLSIHAPSSICSLPRPGVYYRKHLKRLGADKREKIQSDESTMLSFHAMSSYIATSTSSRHCSDNLSLDNVRTLKFPDKAESLQTLNDAAELLCVLEDAFVIKQTSHLTNNEISQIHLDCEERLGELASIAVQKFGRAATRGSAWTTWCERCPNRQLERIAILFHANK